MKWEIATAKETTLANAGSASDMPIVSGDDRWLERWHEHNIEIRSMAGGDWKAVVSQKKPSLDSVLTPDGKWLLYGDDVAGKPSLFRMAIAGNAGASGRLSNKRRGGHHADQPGREQDHDLRTLA